MGKSPGFWFFTGDWMKDPELRFCSIFARGLLVDLLCLMFESKRMGYLSKPDGGARNELEIVDAISGGDRQEKLDALRELVHSGVLSRDSDGCIFSRRLVRLDEVSKVRSNSGSKGGSKTQANVKQNLKQNRGVTDSDSDSDSDTSIKKEQQETGGKAYCSYLQNPEFAEVAEAYRKMRTAIHGSPAESTVEAWYYELCRLPISEAIEVLRFSTSREAKTPITNGDHKGKPASIGHQTSQNRHRISVKDLPV